MGPCSPLPGLFHVVGDGLLLAGSDDMLPALSSLLPLLIEPENAEPVPHCLHPVSDDGSDRVGEEAPVPFLHKYAGGGGLLVRLGKPALAGHVCLLLVARLALLLGLGWTASCLSCSLLLFSGLW